MFAQFADAFIQSNLHFYRDNLPWVTCRSRAESSLLIESKPNQQTHAQPVLQPPHYTMNDRSHRLAQNQQIQEMHQCFQLSKNEMAVCGTLNNMSHSLSTELQLYWTQNIPLVDQYFTVFLCYKRRSC